MRARSALICGAVAAAAALAFPGVAGASPGPTAGANVRVTVDTGSAYVSADQLAGGTYTDAVLTRCGIDRRMQNEPTLAIDPRNTSVWASGSNDYCTVPTAGDAWAGFYRSTNGAPHGPTACCPAITAISPPRAWVRRCTRWWPAARWRPVTR